MFGHTKTNGDFGNWLGYMIWKGEGFFNREAGRVVWSLVVSDEEDMGETQMPIVYVLVILYLQQCERVVNLRHTLHTQITWHLASSGHSQMPNHNA